MIHITSKISSEEDREYGWTEDDTENLLRVPWTRDAETVYSDPPYSTRRVSHSQLAIATVYTSDTDTICDVEAESPESVNSNGKLERDEVESLDLTLSSMKSSPYEKFRAGRKTLSVTDLLSANWCQVQAQYSLVSKRPRRTSAMKKGSDMHQILEQAVHRVIQFELDPDVPEEKLGLKLMNILSGLDELESGKITRELPIFGFVKGKLVAGVIDQLQYVQQNRIGDAQRTITELFAQRQRRASEMVIIMSDHKTRVAMSVPSETQADQARLQLMLYQQFLRTLIDIDIEEVLRIQGLLGNRTFSDGFLAQALQTLEHRAQIDEKDNTLYQAFSQNNIYGLWSLLRENLARVIPALSEELQIIYTHQESSIEIATKSFKYDPAWLQERVSNAMGWWSGSHEAEGVPIEEAFKCRLCHFENGCHYRLRKVSERSSKRAAAAAAAKSSSS